MFISFDNIQRIEDRFNPYQFHITITDNDWKEETIAFSTHDEEVEICFENTIIDVYGKRNLLIVPNLLRSILFASKKYEWDVEDIISWNEKYNCKMISPYLEDLKKYLLLV